MSDGLDDMSIRTGNNRSRFKKFGCVIFIIMFSIICGGFVPEISWAWPWSHDLFDQPSYKAQEDLPPARPDGIVPFNRRPIHIKERKDAVRVKNPISPDKKSLKRGKAMFLRYCAVCHGETGVGNGPVGKKFVPPTNLTEDYVQDKPDGDIFYTITYGGLAIMPSYGDSIPEEDRWNIINYIKHVLPWGFFKP